VGSLKAIDSQGKVHTFSALFGRRELAASEVRAVKLAELSEKPMNLFRIGLVDAGFILTASITSNGGRLIVRDISGQFLNLPLGIVTEIRGVGNP
jgi:hypothetical protein